jgi:hypothetical protein
MYPQPRSRSGSCFYLKLLPDLTSILRRVVNPFLGGSSIQNGPTTPCKYTLESFVLYLISSSRWHCIVRFKILRTVPSWVVAAHCHDPLLPRLWLDLLMSSGRQKVLSVEQRAQKASSFPPYHPFFFSLPKPYRPPPWCLPLAGIVIPFAYPNHHGASFFTPMSSIKLHWQYVPCCFTPTLPNLEPIGQSSKRSGSSASSVSSQSVPSGIVGVLIDTHRQPKVVNLNRCSLYTFRLPTNFGGIWALSPDRGQATGAHAPMSTEVN